MGIVTRDRQQADQLPEGDVIRCLLHQHAQIRDLFDEVQSVHGQDRREAFEELRAQLIMHETAEQLVLRPITEEIAVSMNREWTEANVVLEQLQALDADSGDFECKLAQFRFVVDAHVEREEREEFPLVLNSCAREERESMGFRINVVERMAPSRPRSGTAGSPGEPWTAGPFTTLVDRAKDAIGRIGDIQPGDINIG